MKQIVNRATKFLLTSLLLFAFVSAFAQTAKDTVKTGKANDPMNVNPGKPNDAMAVKPGTVNDGMSVMSDTAFINKNIRDNRIEIELSKLAFSKGTTPEVKKVANQMITDHTIILNDLKKLAVKKHLATGNNQTNGMTMPPTDLQKGKNFNEAWAAQMLGMHEAKIAELESFVALTQDAELKAAVLRALPKIKMHRDMLSQIPGAKDKSSTSPVI